MMSALNSEGSKTGEGFAAKNPALVVAVDLGGTHLRAAAVDERGRIRHRLKQATPREADAAQLVRAITDAVRECERLISQDLSAAKVRAVSVAVPGNVLNGCVGRAPNIPALNGLPLRELLTAELQRRVTIENDANAAAVGEMWQGAGRGARTLVCVTLGTGVGGGIILDGQLWRGHDGSAAEIGHLAVNPLGGVKCGCGSEGCLEVYASATALVRMARERWFDYPTSPLRAEVKLTAEAIYRAGIAGDELAQQVFRIMGAYLGAGLASLINVINPEIIIIGGGVANGWELFASRMREVISKRDFPLPAAQVKIVRAECGDDAGLLGAAHLAASINLWPTR